MNAYHGPLTLPQHAACSVVVPSVVCDEQTAKSSNDIFRAQGDALVRCTMLRVVRGGSQCMFDSGSKGLVVEPYRDMCFCEQFGQAGAATSHTSS